MKRTNVTLAIVSSVLVVGLVIIAALISRHQHQPRPTFFFLEPKKTVPERYYIAGAPTFSYTEATSLAIAVKGGSIQISYKTGEVTIPKDVELPEAARRFWAAVAEAFPDARRAIIQSDQQPTTTKTK